MTRETKLGLLIGTGIILLIGIVISDQLSVVGKNGAPTAEYGMDTSVSQTGQVARPQQPTLTGLELAPVQDFSGSPGLTQSSGSGMSPQGVAHPDTHPGAAIQIGDPVVRPANPAPFSPQQASPIPPSGQPRLEPLPGAAMAESWGNPVPAMNVQEQRKTNESTPLAMGSAPSTAAPTIGLFDPMPQPAIASVHSTPITSSSEMSPGSSLSRGTSRQTIKVQAGDTLEALARKHLGAGKHWQELLQANSDKLKKPQDLRPGMDLVLPDRANHPAVSPTSPVPMASSSDKNQVAAGVRTYTVQKGDTLYSIAQKQLGKASRWKDILQANKTLLRGDAGNLQPGMKLTLPPESSSTDAKPTPGNVLQGMAIRSEPPVSTPPGAPAQMPLLLDQPLDVHLAPIARPIG